MIGRDTGSPPERARLRLVRAWQRARRPPIRRVPVQHRLVIDVTRFGKGFTDDREVFAWIDAGRRPVCGEGSSMDRRRATVVAQSGWWGLAGHQASPMH